MQTIDIDKNTLLFDYKKDSVFDENILYEASNNFAKLKQDALIVICKGYLPIELLMYLSEVSKHCEMSIEFDIDTEGKKFLQRLVKQQNSNIKFKDE